MKINKININSKKENKKGVILPFVAIGILAVAGLVPFLAENTDTNVKLTQDYDEANKIIWAMESAAQDKLRNGNIDSVSKGLGDQTVYKEVKGDVKFNYGASTSNPNFQAIGEVVQYNSYLNKHFCVLANGTSSKTDEIVNLRSISCGYVKPGVATINNTTYAWDKNGKLYEINNKNELVPVSSVGGKVWQVVAGKNNNPVVLNTALDAYPLIYDSFSDSYTQGNKVKNLYQLANASVDDSFAITTSNNLVDISGKNIFDDGKVEDLAVGTNHGLFLVAKDPNNAAKGYDLYGWGNNESKQINCLSSDKEYSSPTIVNCSLKAPTGVYSGSISPMNDFTTIKDYFQGTYKFPANTSSACYVENPYKAGEKAYHKGSNVDNCTCPLCLDVWDLHSQNVSLNTSLVISEPQEITNLQLMLDNDGCSRIMSNLPSETETVEVEKQVKEYYISDYRTYNGNYYYSYYYDYIEETYKTVKYGEKYPVFSYRYVTKTVTEEVSTKTLYTKCTLTQVDENGNITGNGVSFIAKNNLDNSSSIVTPLGSVYLLDFDDNLQACYDVTGKNVISNEGYTIPEGRYTIKWEYSKDLGKTYQTFADDALFWGIDPKAISEDELIAKKQGSTYGSGGRWGSTQLSLSQQQLFGSIFRLNSNMFNLRGGLEYDDEVPTYYALAAGDNYSLAIIVRKTDMPEDGSKPTAFHIIGWGDDSYGQLGIGVASGPQKMTINPITSDIVANYRDLQAGKYHALFLTKDGKVYSWGGSTTKASPHPIKAFNSDDPDNILKGKKIISVSAGNDCSSAIDNEGNIYTWTVSNETPVVIAGGNSFGQ